MPCYEVNTANVDLNVADHQLLDQALQVEGYQTTYSEKQKQLSFSKGQVREHVDRVRAGDILMMHATWFCEYAAGMLIGTRCCGIWYRKETH
jgi:hypothetical protein